LVQYFLAVVEHGGITKAAAALYIAQPSLSQAIRTLERRLGVELFDRSGRNLVLTPAGSAFEAAARRIQEDLLRAREEVLSVRNLKAGRIELAAMPGLEADPLPELASRLRSQHPGLLLSIRTPDGAAEVVSEVRRGRVELGLTDLPVHAAKLRTWPLQTQELVLVLPVGLADGVADPVPLDTMGDLPMVTTEADLRVLPDTLASIVVVSAQRPATWDLVRAGAGATFSTRRLAERDLADAVVRSTVPRLERTIGFVARPGPLSPAARAFLAVAGVEVGSE